jgi:hypothetical protein
MRVDVVFEPAEASDCLEIPWESADPENRYFDLRENPGALERLEAARRHRPLRSFLAAVNSADSLFSTARSKAWLRQEHGSSPASDVDSCEFASRVDLMFASEAFNLEWAHYDALARRLEELLTRDPSPDTLGAELRVHPCRFRAPGRPGFYLRILLSARGATPEQAELRWGLGLARIQQALLFSSRLLRQQIGQAS